MMSKLKLSFEFYPPKLDLSNSNLPNVWHVLNKYQPHFFSVTFGAGGKGTQHKTVKVVDAIHHDQIRVAPHLSCIGLKKSDVNALLNHYLQQDIKDLVVIRGDLPEAKLDVIGDFKYANDLVSYIRQETAQRFNIIVAAYPEGHPEADNAAIDLQNFKQKVASGADSAITQYFFEAEVYFKFVENCHKLGLTLPLIPGIMPIVNYEKVVKFSKCCGASIPGWLHKRMQTYQHDVQSQKQFGVEVVTQLCEKLIQFGIPGLHLYTLNQFEPTTTILNNLAIKPAKQSGLAPSLLSSNISNSSSVY